MGHRKKGNRRGPPIGRNSEGSQEPPSSAKDDFDPVSKERVHQLRGRRVSQEKELCSVEAGAEKRQQAGWNSSSSDRRPVHAGKGQRYGALSGLLSAELETLDP